MFQNNINFRFGFGENNINLFKVYKFLFYEEEFLA